MDGSTATPPRRVRGSSWSPPGTVDCSLHSTKKHQVYQSPLPFSWAHPCDDLTTPTPTTSTTSIIGPFPPPRFHLFAHQLPSGPVPLHGNSIADHGARNRRLPQRYPRNLPIFQSKLRLACPKLTALSLSTLHYHLQPLFVQPQVVSLPCSFKVDDDHHDTNPRRSVHSLNDFCISYDSCFLHLHVLSEPTLPGTYIVQRIRQDERSTARLAPIPVRPAAVTCTGGGPTTTVQRHLTSYPTRPRRQPRPDHENENPWPTQSPDE